VSNATMALAYAGQMLVQPVDYLRELAAAVVEHGGTVTTSYPVRSIGRHQATGRDTIRAAEVVAATHVPLGMLPATLPWRQARHYAALVQGEKVEVASLDVKAGWSVRPVTPSATRAIVVGSGGSTGSHDTTDALQQLETWARDRLRAVVLQTWSSQDVMTEDQLPYIGRLSPRGPLSATGFGAWGLAHGTAAGLELARRATGAEARWSSGDLTPTRLAKGSMDMVQGAAASASALLEQRVIQPVGAAVGFRRSASTPAELSPGEGRVTYEGAQPLATSCDASGEVRCLSAVCSHMGCTVVWNPAEQTWDCPCHGSRFDVDGRVLHGPAASPLAAR
jgi:nitrite reductase/ring-hydroxylating ferredoxin subunit